MSGARAATGWVDTTAVARALGLAPGSEATDPDLIAVCDAVGAWVADVRSDLTDDTGTYQPTADVARAAVILSVDVYRRPATYGGAGAIFSDLGSLGSVPGVDPMVERFLGIGRYRRGGRVG